MRLFSLLPATSLVLLLLAATAASGQHTHQHGHHHEDSSVYAWGPHRRHPRGYYEQRFLAWLDRFHVALPGGRHEYARRLDIFAANDDFISAHNAGNSSYTLGHNPYSHLTLEEFHARFKLGRHAPGHFKHHALTRRHSVGSVGPSTHTHTSFSSPYGDGAGDEMAAAIGGLKHPLTATTTTTTTTTNLRASAASASASASAEAKEVDWVALGAVTPVKDQGMCGSCWAFSTTGAIEGAYFLKHGKLLAFSEQELVDCDGNDFGCNGGLMDNAFAYLETNGGLALEDAYPYEGTEGRCKMIAIETVEGTEVTGYTDVFPDSDDALVAALAKQPVSIAIEADQREFQLYASGVFTGACGTNLDHGVLAVGYGTAEDGIDYFKVKNSWGPSWGDEGYIYLQRGVSQYGGQCGILLAPSYPSV